MSSSNGGGRKRGRPVILTPEQRLERERERWRRKKARKRKAAQDAAWQRDTNSGYFVKLWVPHYNRLTEALVGDGLLSEADANIAPRVDAAVDAVFQGVPGSYDGRWWSGRTPSRRGPDKQGVARIRMTADLVDRLVAYGSRDQYEASHPRSQADRLIEACRLAEARFRECEAALKLLIPGPERIKAREAAARAEAAWWRLQQQINPLDSPPIDEGDLAKFADGLRHDRPFLRKTAEEVLCQWYAGYVPDQPWHPCSCKLALPECECLSRFKVEPGGGVLQGPPKPPRPRAGKILAKRELYSGPKPRWWRNPRYDDDPVIRSHDKSASAGMKGFDAGEPGYYPGQDDRASTRDWNRTAREGEKALQKPYDDPTGTPKSWSNPSDVAPHREDTITRLGKRLIEETEIEPPERGED